LDDAERQPVRPSEDQPDRPRGALVDPLAQAEQRDGPERLLTQPGTAPVPLPVLAEVVACTHSRLTTSGRPSGILPTDLRHYPGRRRRALGAGCVRQLPGEALRRRLVLPGVPQLLAQRAEVGRVTAVGVEGVPGLLEAEVVAERRMPGEH